MINKQTLIISQKEEDTIISINPSTSAYVDEDYFHKVVGEDETNANNLTFAVSFWCIRADWLINKREGQEFLKEMLRQERKELFETPYMEMAIQFLYKNYSRKIMRVLLPSYLVHMLVITLYLLVAEWNRDADRLETGAESKDSMQSIQQMLTLGMALINCVNLYFFVNQAANLGLVVFTRMWTIVDVSIIISNFVIVLNHYLIDLSVIDLRLIETAMYLLMWFKSLYYLGLAGMMAPLVDIIFVIFKEIKYFMIIYLISAGAFVCAFYVLGKNQLELNQPD
jgi:hypothetical protein